MASQTGWMSRLEIALGTKRRIVLHGNVLDEVLPPEKGLPCGTVEWLRRQLVDARYRRVVSYDLAEPPRVLAWDDREPASPEAWNELRELARGAGTAGPGLDLTTPEACLGMLHRLLVASLVPTAVIVSHCDLRVPYPSAAAVAVQKLTDEAARVLVDDPGTTPEAPEVDPSSPFGATLQNLAVCLYTRESALPSEFLADPATAIIFAPLPSFEDREAYFVRFGHTFYGTGASNVALDPKRLARQTDGCRIAELGQLARLSNREGMGLEHFTQLLALHRAGRRTDPWANLQLADGHPLPYFDAIRGQGDVVDAVLASLCRAKHRISELVDEGARKPPAVLFFVGSTGVGKTMTARCIAEFVTGSLDGLKIIDMSEYRQEHSDQRLVGAPPGYVGYDEGGQLTNWVKSRPHSVVLIDEVEKAHPRILDLFLQILDGARLTDGKGATVDFSDTVLVFTSNIGTTESTWSAQVKQSPGLSNEFRRLMQAIRALDRAKPAAVEAHFGDQVQAYFTHVIQRPELYNRLRRGVIVFQFIEKQVADLVLRTKLLVLADRVNERLARARATVRITPDRASPEFHEVVEHLLARVDFRTFGLRDVDNVVEDHVGSSVARFLDCPPDQGEWHYEVVVVKGVARVGILRK